MDFLDGTALRPPDDKLIGWFEETYRLRLPADFLEALRRGNGGVPTLRTFRQGGRERRVDRMLCLIDEPGQDEANGWYDLTVVLSQLDSRLIDDEDLVGMNVIPIAAVDGGDFLCLDYRATANSPAVAVWDHELSDELAPALTPIAASFAQFAASLS